MHQGGFSLCDYIMFGCLVLLFCSKYTEKVNNSTLQINLTSRLGFITGILYCDGNYFWSFMFLLLSGDTACDELDWC